MKKLIPILVLCTLLTAFLIAETDLMFSSNAFKLLPTKVQQGEFVAEALSAKKICSTYKSPASTNYSSTLIFKFAINGADNEAPPGEDHRLSIIPSEEGFVSPVITFGQKDPASFISDKAPENLKPNTKATIRLDMRAVLEAFEKDGFYENYAGETILASAFKGVYIAGGAAPLSWDFDNLFQNEGYKLKDPNGDGIYELELLLNPYNPDLEKDKVWALQNDISHYPMLQSDQLLVDALYNMSLDETQMLIEDDSTFRTGAKWPGVWTRDISYSVDLAYAIIEPQVVKNSLLRKVKNNRIIQDTGSGGAWPVSSDRVVWTLAAYKLYQTTTDEAWLKRIYPIVMNSLEDDLLVTYDAATGLFKGESSFLDWREQTYPTWMDNVDISQSINLGTNAVYFRAIEIAAEMAKKLGDTQKARKYSQLANSVKANINKYLWNEDKGYYNQYLYGRNYKVASDRFEALGEAFCILFDIADKEKATAILENAPITPYGIPTIYPQIPNIPPYHNNGIWPFVQAYWNLAAAKCGNEEVVNAGLASLYRAAAMFVTNKENFVCETGDFLGTQINSDRQLWSVAGNLAMTYRLLFGMHYTEAGLSFKPFIPRSYKQHRVLEAFTYNQSKLNIEVIGFGDSIKAAYLDGKEIEKAFIPSDLKGEHQLRIEMNQSFKEKASANFVDNAFSLDMPRPKLATNNTLKWKTVNNAASYTIYRNGEVVGETQSNAFEIRMLKSGWFQVQARNEQMYSSFLSEPIRYNASQKDEAIRVELEDFAATQDNYDIEDYKGKGAVNLTKSLNTKLPFKIKIEESGEYVLVFRYTNGSGPWNTDNKCAIRSLYVNDILSAQLIFAQRGEGEWSNWGYSNPVKLFLEEGEQQLEIILEKINENMNGEVNQALLDQLLIYKL